MTQRIVFLDRSTLKAQVRRPAFEHSWAEYPVTAASELPQRLAGATIAITNKVALREETLRRLPDLKMIAVAATGYDVIDVGYCKAHGIAVANIRNYAVHTVPEHAFALITALRRNLLAYRRDVENGRWQQVDQFCFFDHPISDLYGSTLGILGEGVLGQATAHIGRAFGMQVLFADHAPPKAPGVVFTPLERVLAESDVISLHLPLTDQTRNLIGSAELRRMKRTAILINTARGGLVDEQALAQALSGGSDRRRGLRRPHQRAAQGRQPAAGTAPAELHPDAARRLGERRRHAVPCRSADRQRRSLRERPARRTS